MKEDKLILDLLSNQNSLWFSTRTKVTAVFHSTSLLMPV